jgi:hypothetical protein
MRISRLAMHCVLKHFKKSKRMPTGDNQLGVCVSLCETFLVLGRLEKLFKGVPFGTRTPNLKMR